MRRVAPFAAAALLASAGPLLPGQEQRTPVPDPATAGAIVVGEPPGQPQPSPPGVESPAGGRPADAPDEFDLKVLDYRVEKSEAVILRLWEAIVEGRSSGADPEALRGLEERATRLTLETKALRRQRDELWRRLSPAPHTEPAPRPVRNIGRTMPFGDDQRPDDGFAPPRTPTPQGPAGEPPDDGEFAGPFGDGSGDGRVPRLEAELRRLARQNEVLKELVRKRLSSESQGRGEPLEAPMEQPAPPE